jgi:hypothetical protein
MQVRNLNSIRQVLEEHGVEFLGLDGVRLLPASSKVLTTNCTASQLALPLVGQESCSARSAERSEYRLLTRPLPHARTSRSYPQIDNCRPRRTTRFERNGPTNAQTSRVQSYARHTAGTQLQADGERIQREIEEYTALSQQVRQLTEAISESVKEVRASVDQPREE